MIPQENQVFMFEAKLLRLGSRDIMRKDVDKDGNKIVYGGLQRTITLEVMRDEHEALESVPRGAILRGKLYWTNGDDEIDLTPEAKTQPTPAAAPEKTQEGAKAGKRTRTPEQITNGKAWSLLVHKRGFCRAPGVWEQIQDRAGQDDHGKMRQFFGVEHLDNVYEETALATFTYPTTQTMIERAWREARGEN